MARTHLLSAILLVLALAACGGQAVSDETTSTTVPPPSTPIPTAQASATHSADTSPGSTASDVETAQAGIIFFLRPPDEPWTPGTSFEAQLAESDLWVADADGSGERQISSGKTNVSFAGFLVAEDGPVVYYASGDETTFHLWRKALESGAETEVLSFRPPHVTGPVAAVSSDGRQVALVESDDITLADLATGERRQLFRHSDQGAEETDLESCLAYYRPHWSPDGSLLAVGCSGHEWLGQLIVDPSQPLSQPSANGRFLDIPYVQGYLDWKTSDEACSTVVWDGESGLYLIHGPEWAFDPHEAEDITGYGPNFRSPEPSRGNVRQCAWLDDEHIAFWVWSYSDPPLSIESLRIEAIDTETRAITTLTEIDEAPGAPTGADMFVIRGQGLIVYNRNHEDVRHETFTTVGVIQVADGTSIPILRERDYVVAVAESPTGQ
jgi:hypothetical protein